MTIGARLKEERERLGFSQPNFSGLAGTTKKSQIDYEKDITQPKAGYLEVIAKVGADIEYIVTGKRSVGMLPTEEQLILERYRQANQTLKTQILMLLLSVQDASAKVVGNQNSDVQGQQIGDNNQQDNHFASKQNATISISNLHGGEVSGIKNVK